MTETKQQWKPIETARKDGQELLLGSRVGDHKEWIAFPGFWNGYYWRNAFDIEPTHWLIELEDGPL